MAEYSEDALLDAMTSAGKSAEVFLMNIDAAKKALDQEKREYRAAVKRLLAVYKKHLATKRKLEGKLSSHKSYRLTRSEEDVKYAVTAVMESQSRAFDLLKRAEQESNGLFDFYFGIGKSRLAKKENNKFDRYMIREEQEFERIGEPVREIVENYSGEKKRQDDARAYDRRTRDEDEARSYRQDDRSAMQPPHSPYYDLPYRYAPPVQPLYHDPYLYRQSVNISPVHLDVTSIVEESVKEVMDRFVKKIETDLQSAEIPALQNCASVAGGEDISAEKGALGVVAQEETFVVEKLSELVENLKTVMQTIDGLGAACVDLANKEKEISELQRSVNDMQRALLREMQGMQVKQKLLNQEQDALTEQQSLASARQDIVLENQKQINESLEATLSTVESLLEAQKKCESDMKERLHSQKSVIQAGVKNLEMQKELSQKQSELATAIRESAQLHKQAARMQKQSSASRKTSSQEESESVNEESGAVATV